MNAVGMKVSLTKSQKGHELLVLSGYTYTRSAEEMKRASVGDVHNGRLKDVLRHLTRHCSL